MDRPRLKRTAELVTTDAGDIYILRPTDDSDLRIERPDAVARSLLAALDGTRTVLRAGARIRLASGRATRSHSCPSSACSTTRPTMRG